jgi:UDP-N-acetylmuramyl pentapeptide synthase
MWTLSGMVQAVRGELVGIFPQEPLARVVTDTRTLAPHDVFVALKGERFDGHDFVEEAAALRPSLSISVNGRTG